jgi:hypothetical protein
MSHIMISAFHKLFTLISLWEIPYVSYQLIELEELPVTLQVK